MKVMLSMIAALWLFSLPAMAQESEPVDETYQPTPLDLAFEAAGAVAIYGPAQVKLRDQAILDLPEGYIYVPRDESNAVMAAMGNHTDELHMGSIWGEEGDWFVSIDFDDSGYVEDDEARDWDVDAMYDNLVDGTEAQNEVRASQGIPALELTGWIQEPSYNEAEHQLIWSIGTKDEGAPDTLEQGVNYNTYALGREGYIALNLVTGMSTVENDKTVARELLSRIAYNEGKRYSDFNAATDNVAEYGIAALVGGFAAKKVGLFAALGLLLAKFWKLVIIAVIAIGAGARKIFGKRDPEA